MTWNFSSHGFRFEWDLEKDSARLTNGSGVIWNGSLLPSFYLKPSTGENRFVKAHASNISLADDGGKLQLEWEGVASGQLVIAPAESGLHFRECSVTWKDAPPKIISAYYGASQPPIAPRRDEPFWPDWQAGGVCVPSAKGDPPQSFFRFWDLGRANMALGSFGPSGTPYAAAFPRPIYAAALGGANGWVAVGPGKIPDGALFLKVVAGASCLHMLHREDLWGAPDGSDRVWLEPLRLTWADSAWEAYRRHFGTFHHEPESNHHLKSSWNSWSEYRQGIYENERLIKTATETTHPEIFTFDQGWETGDSTGLIHTERFPNFQADLDLVRSCGMEVGLWQAVGWIHDPAAVGLGPEDLLCSPDGVPCLTNWLCSPFLEGRYALDPSSEKTRTFIREKTRRLVLELGAKLLKLDFGYGMPALESAAPRDPALRGEMLAATLYRLMSEAAREANPDISLQGWGLSPLQRPAFNLIAMDDLGDCGVHEDQGHRHWSVWAALLGDQGMPILASSGYDWEQDGEVILDTAIVGCPGSILAMQDAHGQAPVRGLAKRRAIHRWFRRTVTWKPLWLNSEIGSLVHQPLVKCWGRLEPSPKGDVLTALALRDGSDKLIDRSDIKNLNWSGRWAIISQTPEDIFTSSEIACIPLDEGTLHFPFQTPPHQVIAVTATSETHEAISLSPEGILTLNSANRSEFFDGFLIKR